MQNKKKQPSINSFFGKPTIKAHVSKTHWAAVGATRKHKGGSKLYNPMYPLYDEHENSTLFETFMNCWGRSKLPGSWSKKECTDHGQAAWRDVYSLDKELLIQFMEKYPVPEKANNACAQSKAGASESPINLVKDVEKVGEGI